MADHAISILIVDDDPEMRNLLATVFRPAGFEVMEAEDAFVARAIVEKTPPDIVFLDVYMPGKSGLQFLQEMQQVRPEALVVVMTADPSVESAVDATKLGAVEYIAKPFRIQHALELAHRLAAQARERKAIRHSTGSTASDEDVGILIVDDDVSVRLILTELFQDAGFRVDDAEAPFVAIQKLGMARYDLLFLDINMPGMTGLEFLQELRRANSEARAVVMTADPTVESAVSSTRLGAKSYLRKPFSSLDDVLTLAERLADEVRSSRKKSGSLPGPPSGRVSIVFTDVQASTRLWERYPEAMRQALEVHDQLMRRTLELSGGYQVKTEGDAFMIAFATPQSAVRWCIAAQEALLAADWPETLEDQLTAERRDSNGRVLWKGLRVRMGVHLGNPDCRLDPVTGRMDYFGPVVNRAARVGAAGHGGQVLVTAAVWNEIEGLLPGLGSPRVRGLGEYRLRDLDSSERLFEILPASLGERSPFPELRTSPPPTDAGDERPRPRASAGEATLWGKYQLSRNLGTTGPAELFLAREDGPAGLESKVILKRFRADLSDAPEFAERLLDAARAVARVKHPNVTRVLDVGRFGHQYFVVDEYVPGWDLHTILTACRDLRLSVPFTFACRIVCDVCTALAEVEHRADGLIHRDVSPRNIVVSIEDGIAKIGNFGVAGAIDALPRSEPDLVRDTIAYLAPEQLRRDAAVDARADLFAAGVVLWQCLTGTALFERDRPESIRGAILRGPIPRVSEQRPDVPAELDQILDEALQRKPEDRYPTAAAFQADLEKLVSIAPSRKLLVEWLRQLFRKAVESGQTGTHARPQSASS